MITIYRLTGFALAWTIHLLRRAHRANRMLFWTVAIVLFVSLAFVGAEMDKAKKANTTVCLRDRAGGGADDIYVPIGQPCPAGWRVAP